VNLLQTLKSPNCFSDSTMAITYRKKRKHLLKHFNRHISKISQLKLMQISVAGDIVFLQPRDAKLRAIDTGLRSYGNFKKTKTSKTIPQKEFALWISLLILNIYLTRPPMVGSLVVSRIFFFKVRFNVLISKILI